MHEESITRVIEIVVNKNLGSDRLFNNYLLMRIERGIFKYSTMMYVRTIRALADKRFDSDPIFWNDYAF